MARLQTQLETDIEIPFAGFKLEGELILPLHTGGVVLFAHGSGSSRHSPRNQFVARTLREHGVGTMLFDLLTAYEEREDRYTGHLRFNIELLAERLLGATEWFHRQNPDSPIGYFGSSTGAAAALLAETSSPVPIRAIVSRGGRPDLAGDALPMVKAATLLIVGGDDDVVVELNQAALAQMRCEKELRVIPGATHLFEEPGALEQVAAMAAEWFERHFANPAG
ncbi:MAG TPA: alpha/beta hydrolase [Verrucomicrobiae bacterium]|nr:alpha/beta hydrolase [Verrucomicrobiae bacterium]